MPLQCQPHNPQHVVTVGPNLPSASMAKQSLRTIYNPGPMGPCPMHFPSRKTTACTLHLILLFPCYHNALSGMCVVNAQAPLWLAISSGHIRFTKNAIWTTTAGTTILLVHMFLFQPSCIAFYEISIHRMEADPRFPFDVEEGRLWPHRSAPTLGLAAKGRQPGQSTQSF
jgi:hypothetical protein